MLYWRVSSNRVFFINEYWVFIPFAILVNYVILPKIYLDKKRIEELKTLRNQLERERRIRRLVLLSLGLSGLSECLPLFSRGGSKDLIDVDYIKCNIAEGVNYLDNERLRKIIESLYSHKRKGKIIYITVTAACHLINRYGTMFLPLPVAIGDFGLTSVYQTFRKFFVTMALAGVPSLVYIGNPVALIFAFMLTISGVKLGFSNLDLIATSPVDITEFLNPRIPSMSDVIVVNNRNRDKMVMSEPVQQNQECWLAEQQFLNPNCNRDLKPTEIPDVIDSVLPDLKYEETVNMQDITGLDRIEFSDKYDLGQTKPKPSISNPCKGREVNFLDKFGDSGPIGESEGWDISENEFRVSEKRYLRTKNKP